MKPRPSWTNGLSIVKGKWGLGETTIVDTQVSVRREERLEEDIWIHTCFLYLKLYPTLHRALSGTETRS